MTLSEKPPPIVVIFSIAPRWQTAPVGELPGPKPAGCVRIVAWNVRQGFDGLKFDRLLELEPDVAVVPESCTPARLAGKRSGWTSHEWIGKDHKPTKGLGVLSFGGTQLIPARCDTRLERFLPVHVSGPADFAVIATWSRSKHPGVDAEKPKPRSQIEQLPEVYADLFEGPVVGVLSTTPSSRRGS